ncbi:MAG TPA: thiamine ABC transporter substrate-binding protein [Trueperaceae bacterium]|nr:thiamine ABC transporter substrate-binding protein [Trueperaceae bacterium]
MTHREPRAPSRIRLDRPLIDEMRLSGDGEDAPMRRSQPFQVLTITLLFLLTCWVGAQKLTVLTHDSFALPEELVAEFTAATGIEVVFLAAGDAGEVVNRAILTKARPLGDLLYGIDDSLLERARGEDIFESYVSPELTRVPDALHLGNLVTPVDVGYVVPNVDLAWFLDHDVAVPTSLDELADPLYARLTAVQNPASSSPGMAFLLATVARFGDPAAGLAGSEDSGFEDWLDFWAAMRANGVLVTDGWTDAYYTSFTRYGGDRPLVVSYLTSPAAEVIFAETELAEPPTANLECRGCAYRQVEAIGILRGTPNREAAERFVDFMLSREVQEAIPLAMFVHPVVEDADLPPEFNSFASLADDAQVASLPSQLIQAHQARWLAQWTAVVLQGRQPAAVR